MRTTISGGNQGARPDMPRQHRSPLTLEDVLGDLLWPRLLGCWKLAMAPGRWMGCTLLVVALLLLALLSGRAEGGAEGVGGSALGELVRREAGVLRMAVQPGQWGLLGRVHALYSAFFEVPWLFVKEHPVAALVLLPLAAAAFAAAGTAVCRSAACEISLRAASPWRATARLMVRKTPAAIGAQVGPLALAWVLAGLLVGAGRLLFSWPVTSVLGAVAFGVALVMGALLALLVVGYVLGQSMLIPAVAAEGTESYDAVQRAYAYVIARPGRLILYTLIGLASGAIAAAGAALMTSLAVFLAAQLTGAPLEVGSFAVVEREGLPGATRAILAVWLAVVACLLGGFVVSLYFCTCTTIYLIMRRVVDGQDIGELWVPQRAGGAEPGGAGGAGAPVIPPGAKGPDPADER